MKQRKEIFMENQENLGLDEIEQEDENGKRPYKKLDYTITDPQERTRLVHEIVDNTPPEKLTPYYLEELAKYLTETPDTKHRYNKNKDILTDNHMITVSRRETSFEGLAEKLENGEDGIYNLMTGGDKNILLVPKIQITEEDIETTPGLKELREEIDKTVEKLKTARGRQRYLLSKQLKEMRQDQYVLKNCFHPPVASTGVMRGSNRIDLNEHVTIDENGEPVSDSLVSFFNPEHICGILCNYSKLKEESQGRFDSDWWYLMEDFDELVDRALKTDYPILYDIMQYKIEGLQNKTIVDKIKKDYNITYSNEYISTLWRKKIPKIISDKAKEEWIIWHYTFEEYGVWKRCSRCHEVKLAHPYFFSKNKTSKSGYYSLCKECRNKKK
jgi:hypothetical protein